MTFTATQTSDGTNIIKNTETGKVHVSLVHDNAFLSAIEGLQSFVLDTNADFDMAYDWVCDQANCHSFVNDTLAWEIFYFNWQSAAFES